MASMNIFNYQKAVTEADKPAKTVVDDMSFFSPVEATPLAEETPQQRFERTGTPQFDPANVPSDDAFFSPVAEEPEIAPYDYTVAGAPLPSGLEPVADLIVGLNEGLADAVGVPVDDVDLIMRNLGMSGLLDKPGEGKEFIIKELEKLGIGADGRKAGNKFLADIGEGAGQNLIMLSAMMAAAPAMMAARGSGYAANFSRQLGEALIRNPGTAASAEFAAAAGGETGEAIGRTVGGETGATIGGVTGSIMGGPLAAGVSTVLTPVTSLARKAYRGVKSMANIARTGRNLPLEAAPLVSDSAPVSGLISDAIRGDQARVDSIIDRLSSRLTQSADPVESATALQNMQRNAYRRARDIETNEYWSKVDVKRPMNTKGIKTWAKNLRNATVKEGQDEWLPADLMKKIEALPPSASMERLRAIGTLAFERTQSGVMPTIQGVMPLSDRMRANLKGLSKAIGDEVGKAFPNDVELQKATAFSKWLHDRFTRGPVGRFASPRADESQLPNINTAAKQAVADPRFMAQNRDIQRVMGENKQAMPALETAAEQFMRGQLAEDMAKQGPKAAEAFMKKPSTKYFMRQYPKVAAEFQSTTQRLQTMLDTKTELGRSAFIKNLNTDPDTAIRKILSPSNGNRITNARELMKRMAGKPEVLEVARDRLILSLEDAGKTPAGILTILENPDTRKAVRLILGEDNFTRLNRISENATRLMQAESGISRYMVRKGSKVIGSWLGRKLNTGTLQAPEFGGRLAEKLVDDWMGIAENQIFSLAVRDPKWEAILNSRRPNSLSQVRHLKSLMRRVIRIEEASERAMEPALDDLGDMFE